MIWLQWRDHQLRIEIMSSASVTRPRAVFKEPRYRLCQWMCTVRPCTMGHAIIHCRPQYKDWGNNWKLLPYSNHTLRVSLTAWPSLLTTQIGERTSGIFHTQNGSGRRSGSQLPSFHFSKTGGGRISRESVKNRLFAQRRYSTTQQLRCLTTGKKRF